jgi:hypothetical protein
MPQVARPTMCLLLAKRKESRRLKNPFRVAIPTFKLFGSGKFLIPFLAYPIFRHVAVLCKPNIRPDRTS